MFHKVTRLSATGMMVFLGALALAGCLAQEMDESANEESANEESASQEQLAVIRPHLTCFAPNIHVGVNPFACQSGWPGNRTCIQDWISDTNVVSVVALISGPNGEVSHTVTGVGTQQVELTATVHEGDAFSPGKNTTWYNVEWCRRPF